MKKNNPQVFTDGTKFFHVIEEQPKGFEGTLWAVKDDQGNESVLSLAQMKALTPVEETERTQVEREEDFLLYAASGIDPITAAAVTADEDPGEPNDSLFRQVSMAAGLWAGNVMVALGAVLGLWVGIHLYITMLGGL